MAELVQAENEAGALHEDELYSMVMLLLVAGHETTVNLIADGILGLAPASGSAQGLSESDS
jgi:cytochrome P450